jgi:hypothetical protein
VIARPYDHGLVLLRNRGDYDQGIGAETAVTVTLPRPMQPVDPGGGIGAAVTGLELRNGQGAILYDPSVPVSILSFRARREGAAAVLEWEVGSVEERGEFLIDRRIPGGERIRIASVPGTATPRQTYLDPVAPGGGAVYWLGVSTRGGDRFWSGPAVLEGAPDRLPFAVDPGRPNPFRGATRIGFRIPGAGPVRLDILDVAGRRVAVLLDRPLETGDHEVSWDGRDRRGQAVPAGVYYARLVTHAGTVSRRLIRIP